MIKDVVLDAFDDDCETVATDYPNCLVDEDEAAGMRMAKDLSKELFYKVTHTDRHAHTYRRTHTTKQID
jgi:hypothetical protein